MSLETTVEPPTGGSVLIAAEYWRENEGSVELLAAKCTHCGQMFLPKVAICSGCEGDDFSVVPLGAEGRLYAYTVITAAPPGYPVPYAVAYVDFPDGVRVFGHLRLSDAGLPKEDDSVTIEAATLFTLADGRHARGYRFAPIRADRS